jgi:hypothetical protein
MGARFLDWMKFNQRECIAFVCGMIAGGVLGILGAWLK